MLDGIRRDRRSGASALIRQGVRAAKHFLASVQTLPPARLQAALEQFTRRLVESQPSMAAFLTLANAVWLARGANAKAPPAREYLRDALVLYAHRIDGGFQATIRQAAALVPADSLVLTYSSSAAVRLALERARLAGRRFEVVCSESRPMREGLAQARRLADLGIRVHLVVDAALGEWIPKAKLVLLGADAVMRESVASKVGAEALLRAARRARVPAYVMADSSKWLPPALAGFWRVRAEAPEEIAHLRHPKVTVHNRYFGTAPLTVVAGVVWEEGVARPGDIRRRIARLPVSGALVRYLRKARPA